MNNRIKFLVLIIAIVLIWFLQRFFPVNAQAIEIFFKKIPSLYSGIVFVLLYCIVTFFIWLSKDVFRFIAAVIFGAWFSTLLILIAEIINAFILFYFSRSLGRGFVESTLKKRYDKLDERLGRVNFLWLFLFRAVPLVPFRFLDLYCGLTRITFRRYLSAVILGSPLRIFWVQYVLAGMGKSLFSNPYALVEFITSNKPVFIFSLIYLVLVIVVALKIKAKH